MFHRKEGLEEAGAQVCSGAQRQAGKPRPCVPQTMALLCLSFQESLLTASHAQGRANIGVYRRPGFPGRGSMELTARGSRLETDQRSSVGQR